MGLLYAAFGGSVGFDVDNLATVYKGGPLGKLYEGFDTDAIGAHSVLGIERMSNKILQHEMHHIWQSRSMGDSFMSNYFLQGASLINNCME